MIFHITLRLYRLTYEVKKNINILFYQISYCLLL